MINIDKMSEGIDYEMVPSPIENEQAWCIRFLAGPFVETVISFGNLQVDGKEEAINFNFSVIESPIEDLNPDNQDLQQWCGSVLHDVLDMAIAKGDAVINEVK
jgi:hypothetical protein